MVRPRWLGLKKTKEFQFWQNWNRAVAYVATANLIWIIFDISYIPFRSFWIKQEIQFLNSSSLVIPLKNIPTVVTLYDQVKGISPHKESQLYINKYQGISRPLNSEELNTIQYQKIVYELKLLENELLSNKNFLTSGNIKGLEKVKNILINSQKNSEEVSNKSSVKKSSQTNKTLWEKSIVPLLNSNYTRDIDFNGQPLDLSWKIDFPFQIIFLIDILLRTIRLKRNFPKINLRDALLRRWIDIPLLLPFWRVMRLIPIIERLSTERLIQIEPIRAAISQWIVALLAVELFEVLTIRIIDSFQNSISSPDLPQKIRGLCSYQSINKKGGNKLSQLTRLWLPILLQRIGPNLRVQLIALFDHALQKSIRDGRLKNSLRTIGIVEKVEVNLTKQISSGLVDTVLDLSKNAGNKLAGKDLILDQLGLDTLDRFWEELATALENEEVLSKSQSLLLNFLEELKLSSFRELKTQSRVDELLTELDGLNSRSTKS